MAGERAQDVAIVGFGPVGATLAHLLAQQGLTVLLLDREAAAYHLPRAVHFDDEVMRVFQGIGLAQAILPDTHVSPGMRFVDPTGRLLMDWSRPMAPTPQGWHASYRFHQPALEGVLRDALAARPGVVCETATEVTAVAQDAAGVTLDTTRGPRRAAWVVGCDGARSFLRGAIGGGMEDLGFDERWLVVDLVLQPDRAEPASDAGHALRPGARLRAGLAAADDAVHSRGPPGARRGDAG
jgi:3-(3-hydroxy-phenyl)propionate hydroxylase